MLRALAAIVLIAALLSTCAPALEPSTLAPQPSPSPPRSRARPAAVASAPTFTATAAQSDTSAAPPDDTSNLPPAVAGILASTRTESPEPTPAPTETSTPQPTATATPTLPPASAFSAQVISYGEHGAMVELFYDGKWRELEATRLQARYSQNGTFLETHPFEAFEGRRLAELTDALYEPGEFTLELISPIAAGAEPRPIAEITLGIEASYPFIHPIFAQSDFAELPLDIIEVHHIEEDDQLTEYFWYAKDFCSLQCGPEGNYDAAAMPVYLPHSVNILSVSGGQESEDYPGFVRNYEIYYEHPYTGYVFYMAHVKPGEALLDLVGDGPIDGFGQDYPPTDPSLFIPYHPDRVFVVWGPSEVPNMIPHLHYEAQVPVPAQPGFRKWTGYNIDAKFCNCLPESEMGPCIPDCPSISLENYLLAGWLAPNK